MTQTLSRQGGRQYRQFGDIGGQTFTRFLPSVGSGGAVPVILGGGARTPAADLRRRRLLKVRPW